jgi:2-dehydropantoate 2-reductase
MCQGTEQQAVAALLQVGQEFQSNSPEHRMSTLQDLEAGRALEVEATLGYAVRQARQLGLNLPLLDAGYHLAAGIDRSRA